jgi:xanthine dehydrogenase accessory factor
MAEILAVKNGVQLPRDTQVGPAKDGLAPAEIDPAAPVCGTRVSASS